MKLRINLLKFLSFIFYICLSNSILASDSLAEQNVSSSHYAVKETFHVGDNVFVRSLAFDKAANTLWIGTSVGVLQVDVLSRKVLKTITRDNGLANEYVFASYVDKNKNVWFGTNGGGVSMLGAEGWKTYFPMHGLADYWVYSFADEPGKAMWIGTWAGLSRFDYQHQTFKTYLKELVNEWVYGLDVDQQGRLWIGTEGGVNMFDGTSWSVWTHADGLGAENSKGLSFSANTGLGTRTRHDLSILQNGQETFNPDYVFCIKVAPNGNVWAGTWGGGVSFYNGGKRWQNFTESEGLAGNVVYSMYIDSRDYFFGTNSGLSHFNGKNWQTITKNQGLLDSHVYAVLKDSMGNVWVGTRNGVALLEKLSQ